MAPLFTSLLFWSRGSGIGEPFIIVDRMEMEEPPSFLEVFALFAPIRIIAEHRSGLFMVPRVEYGVGVASSGSFGRVVVENRVSTLQ